MPWHVKEIFLNNSKLINSVRDEMKLELVYVFVSLQRRQA